MRLKTKTQKTPHVPHPRLHQQANEVAAAATSGATRPRAAAKPRLEATETEAKKAEAKKAKAKEAEEALRATATERPSA